MHSQQTWMVPVAPIPTPPPVWPLPTVKPGYSPTSLGYKRPFKCTDDCVRWHAGMDLVGVKAGDEVVACEDCEVVSTGLWSHNTNFVLVRNTASMALYGGLRKPLPKKGTFIAAGKRIGEMGIGYSGLHFELYELDLDRKTNSRWYIDQDPPEGLLNPVNYVQTAAGHKVTRETAPQRHEALRELGLYAGTVYAPWTQSSIDALKAAQELLEIETDGVWGPQTEAAIDTALRGEPQTGGEPAPSEPDDKPSGGAQTGNSQTGSTQTGDSQDTAKPPTRSTLRDLFSLRNMAIAGAVGVVAALLWPSPAKKGKAA